MFYTMYLTNLCNRRRWADPEFEVSKSRRGYECRVRVNSRVYTCDTFHQTEDIAREKAAESAYMICRNFSVNDGMYPGQRQGQAGVVQGLPVAIGAGRRSHRHRTDYVSTSYSSGSSSGDSSPRTSDTELETSRRHKSSAAPVAIAASAPALCYCQRGYISRHGRCEYCVRDAGWY